MGLHGHAKKIETACFDTIRDKKVWCVIFWQRLWLEDGHQCDSWIENGFSSYNTKISNQDFLSFEVIPLSALLYEIVFQCHMLPYFRFWQKTLEEIQSALSSQRRSAEEFRTWSEPCQHVCVFGLLPKGHDNKVEFNFSSFWYQRTIILYMLSVFKNKMTQRVWRLLKCLFLLLLQNTSCPMVYVRVWFFFPLKDNYVT